MVNVKDVLQFLEEIAPTSLAEEWDNVGLMINSEREVQNILVALDITTETVKEAAAKNCELIVSHHPVIFKPLKSISASSAVYALIKQDTSAICMHTNLDVAEGGVSDALFDILGLENRETFGGCGRIGTLPQRMTAAQLAKHCKLLLGEPMAYCDAGKLIEKVAVVGGAGGDFFEEATLAGADCLLSGEVGHHDALDAKALGLSTIAASHFTTEIGIVPVLAKKLQTQFPTIKIYETQTNQNPFSYI